MAGSGREQFDAAYYQRFYGDAQTRVTDAADTARLARFVAAYCDYLRIPVRRILDVGCGLGLWRAPLLAQWPAAAYCGVEYSRHLCKTLGWTRGSVASFRGRGRYDLVICQGVLPYLSASDAHAGIANLARLCRGIVYIEAVTREDWESVCDRSVTDPAMRLRSATWYRESLGRYFVPCGGGLFLPHDSATSLYALECTES